MQLVFSQFPKHKRLKIAPKAVQIITDRAMTAVVSAAEPEEQIPDREQLPDKCSRNMNRTL